MLFLCYLFCKFCWGKNKKMKLKFFRGPTSGLIFGFLAGLSIYLTAAFFSIFHPQQHVFIFYFICCWPFCKNKEISILDFGFFFLQKKVTSSSHEKDEKNSSLFFAFSVHKKTILKSKIKKFNQIDWIFLLNMK